MGEKVQMGQVQILSAYKRKNQSDRVGQTLLEYGREGLDIALKVQVHSLYFSAKIYL